MKNLLLDTNVFLRFFLNDIPSQANQVAEIFSKAQKKKIKLFVPQIVIFEILFALDKYYHFPKEEIIDKLQAILTTSFINIQDNGIFKEALQLFRNQNIDFVDSFLICQAKSKEGEIFSFDQKVNKLSVK